MKKRAKFGRCWGCGAFTPFVCARCHKPVCVVLGSPVPAVGCSRLRAAPGKPGVYHLVHFPRCIGRRAPHVLAVINRKVGQETITYYETEKPDGSTVFVTVPESEHDE